MSHNVVSRRFGRHISQHFFDQKELDILNSLIDICLPEMDRYVPIAEILGASLEQAKWKRIVSLISPRKMREYKQGLSLLDAEALRQYGEHFSCLRKDSQIELLENISRNVFDRKLWKFPADVFIRDIDTDIVYIYTSFTKDYGKTFLGRFYNPIFS